MKICCRCKEEKHLEEFHNSKKTKDGVRPACKECTNSGNRKSFNRSSRKSETEDDFKEKESLAPDGYKFCRGCKEYKMLDKFYKAKTGKDGLRGTCNDCHSSRGKNRYESKYKGTEELKLRANKERLIRQYGLTIDQYNEKLIDQNFSCKICKKHVSELSSNLYVDHDHACCPGAKSCGDCVRGLLCLKCNAGIGMFGDSMEALQSAIDYLLEHRL